MCREAAGKHPTYHVNAVSGIDAKQCTVNLKGEMMCFKCEAPGHFARDCPERRAVLDHSDCFGA